MKKLYRSLWYFRNLPRIVRILPVLVLTGCATPPLTSTPKIPTVHSIVADGGYYYDEHSKDVIVKEGVPENYFVKKPRGWWLSAKLEPDAAAICFAHRNHGMVNAP
jgi:hypothetical protein